MVGGSFQISKMTTDGMDGEMEAHDLRSQDEEVAGGGWESRPLGLWRVLNTVGADWGGVERGWGAAGRKDGPASGHFAC